MEENVHFPVTISLLIILLNSSLVYYIVNLIGTDFPNITTGTCKFLPYYYIEVFMITGIYLIVLSLHKCINIYNCILVILETIYILLFIGSVIFIYVEPQCISMFKTTDTMIHFYYVMICHYTVSLMIIALMIISLLYTIRPKKNIYKPLVLNNND